MTNRDKFEKVAKKAKEYVENGKILNLYQLMDHDVKNKKDSAKGYEESYLSALDGSFENGLLKIIKENPFENGEYNFRGAHGYVGGARGTLNAQKKRDFCSDNRLETSIQRHLFLLEGNHYQDTIGIPIAYEMSLANEDSNAKFPIDLISFNEKENTLYLIELKKCRAKIGTINEKEKNKEESPESLMRPIFQIKTYQQVFECIMNNEKESKILARDLEELANNRNLELKLNNVKIKTAIVAPKRMYSEVYDGNYDGQLKKLKTDIEYFVINLAENIDDLSNYKISEQIKLFNIEPYQFEK